MIAPTLHFDRLYAISDLHLGGAPGHQMFGSGDVLVALIDHIAAQAENARCALLINGDFVDFLAQPDAVHFDPHGAVGKLNAICAEPAFAPIFDALGRLLSVRGATLVVNLGNHDLELALPWVRVRLQQVLCGGDPARLARLELVLDGTGVRCRVGGSDVLALHGNEFDAWNVADFERIRRIARDLQFGVGVEAWQPNAGTRLVIEAMNDIKQRYPFVDLLKPETRAVAQALLVIDPTKVAALAALLGPAARLARDRLRMELGFLDAREPAAAFTSVQMSEDQFLDRLDATLVAGEDARTLAAADGDALLGVPMAIAKRLMGKPDAEVLREALQFLDDDTSFDLHDQDATYREATARIDAKIPFVLTGHTHLPRAIARSRGAYFNSGTWARVIRIPLDVRTSEQRFARVYEALSANTIDVLDAAESEPGRPVVDKPCTVVLIERDGSGTDGSLRRATLDAAGRLVLERLGPGYRGV